ncbi:MAG: xanthine dehydrogenase family protein molybdopterin-binding subunit [Armatimonadota bacterium]|nr:xanthine dehydrogenase family protein molybdopterin-binding subunit [Armatimonadota bacterium]MDR7487018.1 xanthine dehydrogenase family protein molybdopterin-binding subunit [Armatimonadota bacterium]MDR7533404.1 xanthine dehydrogenase family protein molybdopterin-binding subunit [Armatimonadota bacterium]MDR7535228.1 xanthine dehydrogenase family protein molybdopterin-binding subunit [Armatimonadota bacterium]
MARSAYRGARIKRLEDPRLLTGHGTYTGDLTAPGLGYVAMVRSPLAHARVRGIRAPAGIAVITARDIPDLPHLTGEIKGGAVVRHPVLAIDRVCYVGQPVAIVVADDPHAAADAAERVEVDYEALPVLADPEEALASGARAIHDGLTSNVAYRRYRKCGDPDAAFAGAPVVVRQRIRHQRLAAVPLEPRAVLAVPPSGRRSRRLTVWSSTQMPHDLGGLLAALPHLAGLRIRVIAPDVGGGFGAKINIYPEELLVPILAVRLGRPLKWVQTRREDLLATSHGRAQFADVELAADRDGRVRGLRMRIVADVGAYMLSTTAEVPTLTAPMASGPYHITDAEIELVEVYTNRMPTGAYRGAGRPEAAFYLERMLDLLARDVGLDPAEVRRRNFIPPDRFPYRNVSGYVYDSGDYARALDRALDAADYAGWRARQAEGRQQGRYLGIGIASYVEWCTYGEDRVRVEVDAAGMITVFTGISPHGQGTATGLAQVVADVLGAPLEAVTVVHGDTGRVPRGEGTAGSRSLVVGGTAAYRASQSLRRKLLALAAARLEARVEDLVLADGRIHVAGTPERGLTVGGLVADTGRGRLWARGAFDAGDATFPFGTHVAVVEIDPDTGQVRLLQYVAVDDCGVVINPLLVDGQIHGGVTQGLAQALYEDLVYDGAGQLVTASLADYAVPRAPMVPRVQAYRTETPTPRNPLGAKGVGEAGTIGAAPAVVNAVMDALAPWGVRHLDMPLWPGTIWRALHAARRGTV